MYMCCYKIKFIAFVSYENKLLKFAGLHLHVWYIFCAILAHTRLADLHRTMNVHTKPLSVTGDDERAWLGAWPSGRMVGKKGGILKFVSQLHLFLTREEIVHVHTHC